MINIKMLTLAFTSKKMANISRFKDKENYFKLLNGLYKIKSDFCFNAILS